MAGEKAEKIKEYVGDASGVGQSGGSVAAQENEEFAGVAFVVGEGNWWSGKKKSKKHKSPRSQEISRVAGFFAVKEAKQKRNGEKGEFNSKKSCRTGHPVAPKGG